MQSKQVQQKDQQQNENQQQQDQQARPNNQICHRKPAKCWEEVHPIGNGSLGAMIWGTIEQERLGLNLDTLWSGIARDTNNAHAVEYLQPIRQEIFQGHYAKAARMTEEHLLGEFGENYLPLGELLISFQQQENGPVENYNRRLDLEKAVETICYKRGQVSFRREYYASYPDKAIVIQESASQPVTLCLQLTSQLKTAFQKKEDGIYMEGQCPEHVDPSYLESACPVLQGEKGIRFAARLRLLDTDGKTEAEDGSFLIRDMTHCTLVFQAVSGSREHPLEVPEMPMIQDTEIQLRKRHLKDYQSLFSRVALWLGEAPELPTDERIRRVKEGMEDPALFALLFQYGRYLLIASSRKGSEAANLQGIWNWEMRAPWSSNYTTNINVEMNYWPAQICNLAECMEPYFTLLSQLVLQGEKTARVQFGCRGFCVGHNTDFWRITNPVGIAYGGTKGVPGSSLYAFFVLSGQWMCQELWKAYTYQEEMDFLAEFAYPILKKAVLFLVDWLVPFHGYYVTCPSSSPENQFRTKEGISPISMGTTIDMTIVRETFTQYELAYRELQKNGRLPDKAAVSGEQEEIEDAALYAQVKEKMEHLPPYQIGEDGRLLEWLYPFEETEPGHRHISHAYGLFPGNTFRKEPALLEACRKSIRYRLEKGGGHTGWSCAWIVNLFAVLGDAEQAYQYLNMLMQKSVCDNLWTSHPPYQIDANFGATMAIAQMLVQEDGAQVKVLPALPKAWKQGAVRGLCLTGNRTIDITWKNGEVSYQIHLKKHHKK